jgi:hypothetical protein
MQPLIHAENNQATEQLRAAGSPIQQQFNLQDCTLLASYGENDI